MFAEVHFRLAGGDQPLILIPAHVDGRGPYEFILDTGAGTSLLSRRLADDLGIAATSAKDGMGAGGPVKVELATVQSLAVGGARRGPMPVAVTAEVERIGDVVGAQIDGDLGYDFLRDYRVTVDYTRQLVRLVQGNADTVAESPHRSETPFQVAAPAKPLVVTQVMVNGRGPYSFAVDTGASITTMSPELAETLAIESTEPMSMAGGGGVFQATVGRADSIAVGNTTVQGLTVVVSDFLAPIAQILETRIDGVLGYNFLRRFRVTIDYPAATLSLVTPD